MKRTLAPSLILLLAMTAQGFVLNSAAQADMQAFWEKFRMAVIKSDKTTVAAMSKFPIEMSYGIASVKSKAELNRRYREIFNQQTNAAKCFESAKPEVDAGNSKRFSVACPDAAGNEVVVYSFVLTRAGWKFASLDNLNE